MQTACLSFGGLTTLHPWSVAILAQAAPESLVHWVSCVYGCASPLCGASFLLQICCCIRGFFAVFERSAFAVSRSLCSLVFAVFQVPVVKMPHRHSADARLRRRSRAERRCYVTAAPAGCRHVVVDAALVQRVKDMAFSLQLHREHNRVSGKPVHYARQAALNASAVIGHQQAAHAMGVHRKANRAKHDWKQSQRGLVESLAGRRSGAQCAEEVNLQPDSQDMNLLDCGASLRNAQVFAWNPHALPWFPASHGTAVCIAGSRSAAEVGAAGHPAQSFDQFATNPALLFQKVFFFNRCYTI